MTLTPSVQQDALEQVFIRICLEYFFNMANLPPRPESPLRMPPREERRHLSDERDRDRRSALPMAPRYRNERYPDRERPYASRPIVDSYVAPGYDGRRGPDRRDFDDRDRTRRDYDKDARERDRRNWERQQRERERERSPRRLNSPDRDRERRPFDRERGAPRRSVVIYVAYHIMLI